MQVFEKMHGSLGGSIIRISHQERILIIADKIVVIDGGSIKATGTKEEVLPELLGTVESGCRAISCKEGEA